MTAEQQLQYLRSPQASVDAQDFLGKALRLDARISLKLSQLDVIREKRRKLCHALGITLEQLPRDQALTDREEEVLADYAALLREKHRIAAHVRRVPDPMQRSVLEMRYLEAAPFYRIAMALHYDERQIYRLHRAGLRHVAAQLMQEGLAPPFVHNADGEP